MDKTTTNQLDNDSIACALLAEYRGAHPKSRAVALTRLIRNGASVRQYGCVLCGEEGPTSCARYRETKRSAEWRRDHVLGHVAARAADPDCAAFVAHTLLVHRKDS